MENKLELKHLAPYLPYGLQGKYNLKDVQAHYPDKVNDKELKADSVEFFLKYCKPLLIPLSELTEEQWIEVFKAGSDFFSNNSAGVFIYDKYVSFDDGDESYIFSFDRLSFEMPYNQPYFNQLAAFNKLFELHADVYGLLEAGLALNKLEHGK